MRRAVVESIGHYLPERVVENSEFEATLETNDAWIRSRTGIERRHFAAEGETTSDMGIKAAQSALANAGCSVADVDAIILATSTADLTFPSAATMVQHGLGMNHGFAFDVQAVCAGFLFALNTANSMIASGQANRILVIGAETFSKLMDWTDRGTCVLFGDGAGAMLIAAQEDETSRTRNPSHCAALRWALQRYPICRWRCLYANHRASAHAGQRGVSACGREAVKHSA
jgi:3-oxoacyl-[acyl-carrier-protein] synthase-3